LCGEDTVSGYYVDADPATTACQGGSFVPLALF
jgi:hypothetical protein